MVFKDQAIWKETDWSVILHRYHIKTLAKEGKSKILSRCYITSITISMLNVVDKKKKLTEYDFVRAMEKEEDLFFGVSEIVSY